ncbi:MAG: Holliday junction branch migration protein RuvA, partial [Propionibacteriaceae bacterium]|nr:Holliday junction branch migration protein RuvA [Propionibacteriaceae bacterium]
SASGVGPKVALAITSVLSPADFRRAIQTEDLARLMAVPGIGRKGAQRIVIELKDKVVALGVGADDEVADEVPGAEPEAWRAQVSEGLQSLGWSARDADAACDNVAHLVDEDPDISMGKLLRAALNSLARR